MIISGLEDALKDTASNRFNKALLLYKKANPTVAQFLNTDAGKELINAYEESGKNKLDKDAREDILAIITSLGLNEQNNKGTIGILVKGIFYNSPEDWKNIVLNTMREILKKSRVDTSERTKDIEIRLATKNKEAEEKESKRIADIEKELKKESDSLKEKLGLDSQVTLEKLNSEVKELKRQACNLNTTEGTNKEVRIASFEKLIDLETRIKNYRDEKAIHDKTIQDLKEVTDPKIRKQRLVDLLDKTEEKIIGYGIALNNPIRFILPLFVQNIFHTAAEAALQEAVNSLNIVPSFVLENAAFLTQEDIDRHVEAQQQQLDQRKASERKFKRGGINENNQSFISTVPRMHPIPERFVYLVTKEEYSKEKAGEIKTLLASKEIVQGVSVVQIAENKRFYKIEITPTENETMFDVVSALQKNLQENAQSLKEGMGKIEAKRFYDGGGIATPVCSRESSAHSTHVPTAENSVKALNGVDNAQKPNARNSTLEKLNKVSDKLEAELEAQKVKEKEPQPSQKAQEPIKKSEETVKKSEPKKAAVTSRILGRSNTLTIAKRYEKTHTKAASLDGESSTKLKKVTDVKYTDQVAQRIVRLCEVACEHLSSKGNGKYKECLEALKAANGSLISILITEVGKLPEITQGKTRTIDLLNKIRLETCRESDVMGASDVLFHSLTAVKSIHARGSNQNETPEIRRA